MSARDDGPPVLRAGWYASTLKGVRGPYPDEASARGASYTGRAWQIADVPDVSVSADGDLVLGSYAAWCRPCPTCGAVAATGWPTSTFAACVVDGERQDAFVHRARAAP